MAKPAAQYLRISKEDQREAISLQARAIAAYAQRHGFEIVRTYEDSGRTGLVLRERPGLQQLLGDVVSGRSPFETILVHDISRWGRFQDTDEAAHYEFLCKSAGVPVIYCAEELVNDGTPISHLMKALRRSMAAEYSRELGEKVFAGQKRLASMGFWMGAAPGYGLRRMLIAPGGERRELLAAGQRKDLTTDRVVLVLGPVEEVACVRWIYSSLLRGMKPAAICRVLQAEGAKRPSGMGWTLDAVLEVLRNPKYMGCVAWGRTSIRLHGKQRRIPPAAWTVKPGAFEPIVDSKTYEAAQAILSRPRVLYTQEQLLRRLRELLSRHGKLSPSIINSDPASPSLNCFYRRFGTLRRAYSLVGFKQSSDYARRIARAHRTRSVRRNVMEAIESAFPDNQVITIRDRDPRRQQRLLVDGKLIIAVCICRRMVTKEGHSRWVFDPAARHRHLPILACLLNRANDAVERFYLFERVTRVGRLRFGVDHAWLRTGQSLKALTDFYAAARELGPRAT